MSNARDNLRTSIYLVRRAEALLGAIKFFASTSGETTHRRLQFLAQSDLWEWELDNLIYSFQNLAERQKTWSSSHAALHKLGQLGIAVDAKIIRRVRWRHHWHIEQANRRVAPIEILNEVVAIWNKLIDEVEAQLITPTRERAEKWNIQTRTELATLRRTVPILKLGEQECHEVCDEAIAVTA